MIYKEHLIELYINGKEAELVSQDSVNIRFNNVLFDPTKISFTQAEYSFEFDLPIVGLELKSTKAHHSLYWPFHYLSTGRVCIFRSINKTGKEKFLVGDIPCNRPCKKLELELRKPLNGYHFEHGIRKSSQYLMQKGNTLFYLYENPNISQQFTQFDRIILQIL